MGCELWVGVRVVGWATPHDRWIDRFMPSYYFNPPSPSTSSSSTFIHILTPSPISPSPSPSPLSIRAHPRMYLFSYSKPPLNHGRACMHYLSKTDPPFFLGSGGWIISLERKEGGGGDGTYQLTLYIVLF